MRHWFLLCICVLLATCLTADASGQSKKQDAFSKKRSTYIVEIIESPATTIQGCAVGDSNIMQLFASAFQSGLIKGYSAYDNKLTTAMTYSQLFPEPACIIDTEYIIDPQTGEEKAKPREPFDYRFTTFRTCKVLVDHFTDPRTGKARSRIVAIGPRRDVYRDDGSFIGSQTAFFLRYDDAIKALKDYDRCHPHNTFTKIVRSTSPHKR